MAWSKTKRRVFISYYLMDSTVTTVMIGSCTHSRRFIDWEIKSSSRQGDNYTPNGLMGIVLPFALINNTFLPNRLWLTCKNIQNNNYAKTYYYPKNGTELGEWIDDAYNARTERNHLINNPQEMMNYNGVCKIHSLTH